MTDSVWIVEEYGCDHATIMGVYAERCDALLHGYALAISQWWNWCEVWADDPYWIRTAPHALTKSDKYVRWSAYPHDSVQVTRFEVVPSGY